MFRKNKLALAALLALLCVSMVFSVSALAADEAVAKIGETEYATLAAAVDAADEGDTIVLLEQIVVENGETVTIDKNVTITTSVTDVFTVNAGGTLNLGAVTVNSTSSILWANGGTINIDGAVLTQTGSTYSAVFAENNGQINLKSGKIEAKNNSSVTVSLKGATLNVSGGQILHDSSSAVAAKNGATVTVTGGEIKTTAEEAYCAAFATSGGEIIVSGGEISAANDYGVIAAVDGKVTVSGGTVDGVLAHENANASATISGGIINGSVTAANDATVTVTGGSFEQDVTEFCDADHHTVKGEGDRYVYGAHAFDTEWNTDEENHWHECACGAIADHGEHSYADEFDANCDDCDYARDAKKLVAMIGTQKFETLEAAFAAAQDGDTITLMADITLTNAITVADMAVTLEGEFTITTSVTDVFTVNAGGTLNLGAVTINSTSSILWANGGIINIDGATLTATGSPYAVAFAEKEGQINLKSGTIESKNSNSVTIDVTDEKTTFTISGGKVLHDSSSAIAARNKAVVNINGGEVKTTAEEAYCAAFATSGAEIIVSGGEISAANDYGVIAAADGKVTISGGTVDGVLAHENANASATISGGIINGSVTAANDATVTVTGGSFEEDVTEFCDADHHTVKGEGDRYVYGAHAFDTEWNTDEENHWHECACGAIANLGEHTYEEGSCTDCGLNDGVPPTGDSVLVPVVVIMMLSVAAIVVLNKKRVIA